MSDDRHANLYYAAERRVLSTPAITSEMLMGLCEKSTKSIEVDDLITDGDIDVTLLSVGELLACVLLADNTNAIRAKDELFCKLSKALRQHIIDDICADIRDAEDRAAHDALASEVGS